MAFWNLKERKEERARPVGSQEIPEDVRLSERLYDSYSQAQFEWAIEAANNVDLFHNIPFTDDQVDAIKQRGLAPVGIPLLHQVVRQHVAMLTHNTPSIQAVGREDSDPALAKVWADLFSYVWYISKGNRRLRRIVQDDVVEGRGVFFTYIDPHADSGRGEVFITDLDPQDVYPDPNSKEKDWSDAAHIIVSRIITREQALSTWPDKEEEISRARMDAHERRHSTRTGREGQTLKGDIHNNYHERLRLIERYSKILVKFILIVEGQPPQSRERLLTPEEFEAYRNEPGFAVRTEAGDYGVYQAEEVAQYQELYLQAGGNGEDAVATAIPLPDGSVTEMTILPVTKGDLINLGVIKAKETLEHRVEVCCSLGASMLYKATLPSAHYPIVPYSSEHDRTPYPTSDAAKVRPIIEEYNKKQQIIIAHATSIAGTKYWAQGGPSAVDHSIEEKLARPGADVLYYFGDTPPTPNNPPQLPGEFYLNQDRLKAELRDALGYYPLSQGDPSSSPETVRGTLFIDEASQRRVKSKTEDLYESLNQLGLVVGDFIRATYTQHKIIRLVQPSGPPRTTAINQPIYDDFGHVIHLVNDITASRYDWLVVSGSTLPSSRWAQAEYFRSVLEIVGPAFLPEYLKKLEIPNVEEVLERADLINQQQSQLEQMQEEIKKLKGDLQTSERETFHAKQAEELSKFKASLAEPKERVKKEAELTVQRMQDGLSMQKTLMEQIDQL